MNNMNPRTIEAISQDGILARNKVLRQTYILLGMNVLFSAVCAFVGMKLGIGRISPVLAIIAMLGLSWGIPANRNNGLGIVLLFALTGFLGFYLSHAMNMYVAYGMGSVVVKALVGTAVLFFGLSAYVLFTGTNFTFLGGFLYTGMMVVILAIIGSLFFDMSGLSLAISAACLILFSGYVLYDTSNIIQGEETNYIMATLQLFLDIFNIFISLLNLLSAFNRN